MKKLLTILLCSFVSINTAHAATGTRSLVCKNNSGNITFGICGVRGCPAVVTVGTKSTSYVFNRTKNSDGSLTYTPRASSNPKCTIQISSLRNGVRTVTSASCASSLKTANCTFIDN